ncbi:hypothetical protein DFH08DRAFT_617743, partial [Mycena albidolilacea]
PYPGDELMSEDDVFSEERFGVCRLNDNEHIIFDHATGIDVLINSALLEGPEFCPGLWYAGKRHEEMGLWPNDVPREERYLLELGDAL